MAFALTSTAFTDGTAIPAKYTCDEADVSPPLAWSGAPSGTVSFALIVDDPDAPGGAFTHWVLFNLPASATSLPEGVPTTPQLSGGGVQGQNDFPAIGYGGPCPPAGPPHHYRFTVYALDATLSLSSSATRAQILQAKQGHILAQGQLIGLFATPVT